MHAPRLESPKSAITHHNAMASRETPHGSAVTVGQLPGHRTDEAKISPWATAKPVEAVTHG